MNSRLLKTLSPSPESSRQAVIQGAVRVGKGTTIGPNTVIRKPVTIGNDCEIGPNCCIMPNTSIGSRVTIEPFTLLENSLVMDDTSVGSHSPVFSGHRGAVQDIGPYLHLNLGESPMEIEGVIIKPEFGAIIGDQVTSGSFAVYSNCITGNNAKIGFGSQVISRILPYDSTVM